MKNIFEELSLPFNFLFPKNMFDRLYHNFTPIFSIQKTDVIPKSTFYPVECFQENGAKLKYNCELM